jgi:hypothetical protein
MARRRGARARGSGTSRGGFVPAYGGFVPRFARFVPAHARFVPAQKTAAVVCNDALLSQSWLFPKTALHRKARSMVTVFSVGRCQLITALVTALSFASTFPLSASAETLMGWDFSTLTGGSANFGPSPMAATTSAAAITVGGLTRGVGVGSTAGSGAARAWGGNAWNGNATLDAAIAAGDFITFSLTPLAGYSMSLSDVAPYNVRRSSAGVNTGQWQYQVSTGAFTDIGTPITWGSDFTATGNLQQTITLSGISDLQNVPAGTSVTFRVVNWNASGALGTWYLNSLSTTADLDFVINGNLTAVPEPSTVASLISGLVFGAFSVWRRHDR